MMFVTVFTCILNLDTGLVQFANGGHNLPYKFNPEKEISGFPKTKGPALGVMPNAEYEQGEITLNSHEGIFLYTDGVNEAEIAADEFFGYDRLVDILKNICDKSSKEIVCSVRDLPKNNPRILLVFLPVSCVAPMGHIK